MRAVKGAHRKRVLNMHAMGKKSSLMAVKSSLMRLRLCLGWPGLRDGEGEGEGANVPSREGDRVGLSGRLRRGLVDLPVLLPSVNVFSTLDSLPCTMLVSGSVLGK